MAETAAEPVAVPTPTEEPKIALAPPYRPELESVLFSFSSYDILGSMLDDLRKLHQHETELIQYIKAKEGLK